MDFHCLDAAIQECFTAALAPATHETYKVSKHRYVAFCETL